MQKPLRYPRADIHEQTDYLQIGIIKYIPIKENNGSSNSLTGTAGSRRIAKSQGTVYLPIPSNIQDGNSVTYGDSSLNSIAGAAAGGVMKIMGDGKVFTEGGKFNYQKGIDTLGSNIGNTIDQVTNAAGGIDDVAGFFTRNLASSAVGILGANITPAQILARQTGEILNPNLELLFDKPTLRSFRFSFNMVPRSAPESEEIKQIIRLFKVRMAPRVDKNTPFLKTPSVFQLRYKQGKGNHKFLNQFKQCFLTDISVNYTGSGTYATYDDGTPVSIKMDLSFKEIEPIYNTDYEDSEEFPSTGVGY